MTTDESDVRRDVVVRLGAAGIDYYVTGSEAMAMHGIAYRQTVDTDYVLAVEPADYERCLRPAFEPDYLVSPLVKVPSRWMGSAIHVQRVVKADFILRRAGGWSNEAFARRIQLDDPLLGRVYATSLEDLLLAKLEWADGHLDGVQGRDARAIVGARVSLDAAYLRRWAPSLGVDELLQRILARDA